jgi:UDP-N-acetylmuramate dehydrogenase
MRGIFVNSDASVTLQAGEGLTHCIKTLSYSGIELLPELAGIPGTVGGAVYNNAGAFGASVSDRILYADALDLRNGDVIRLNSDDLALSYRHSVLHERRFIVINCTFATCRLEKSRISDKIRGAVRARLQLHPKEPSVGSFFKRDAEVVPAYLIDRLHLKGYSIGAAAISERHAGFIINKGGASAADVEALASFVESSIYNAFGVKLLREAEYIG